jgi:alpha-1,2-rhamnosyltransferase
MLYDLVPVLLPEMCVPELVASFENWMEHAVRQAGFFVCISKAVAEECRRHLELRFPGLRHQQVVYGSIRLGAELDLAPSGNAIRTPVRGLFEAPGRPGPYLVVGTIEPRKNHWYLLDAFDSAWTQDPDASLCIVGKKGWKCDHVLKRIARHPQLGRRLFMFNDLSDGELRYCYGKARAVILPSLAEGFGLPVVEALSLGCRVWASDIPVFREVGGEYCLYFDLRSPQSLAELIRRDGRGKLAGTPRPLAEFHWPDWEESCRELLQKILELVR